jgi:hypothetical protein
MPFYLADIHLHRASLFRDRPHLRHLQTNPSVRLYRRNGPIPAGGIGDAGPDPGPDFGLRNRERAGPGPGRSGRAGSRVRFVVFSAREA